MENIINKLTKKNKILKIINKLTKKNKKSPINSPKKEITKKAQGINKLMKKIKVMNKLTKKKNHSPKKPKGSTTLQQTLERTTTR